MGARPSVAEPQRPASHRSSSAKPCRSTKTIWLRAGTVFRPRAALSAAEPGAVSARDPAAAHLRAALRRAARRRAGRRPADRHGAAGAGLGAGLRGPPADRAGRVPGPRAHLASAGLAAATTCCCWACAACAVVRELPPERSFREAEVEVLEDSYSPADAPSGRRCTATGRGFRKDAAAHQGRCTNCSISFRSTTCRWAR